jgi:REP element-mobilizing transposase RayT
MENPQRAHLHRLHDVWIKSPIYFLTICTWNRRRLLLGPDVPLVLRQAWRDSVTCNGWAVGRYVIMPDHVHFFARPALEAKSISAFVRDWKKWTARRIAEEADARAPIWQAEFFDHVLRSPGSYAEKWAYVRENPVRARLVDRAEDWPHAGECEPLVF